MRSMMPWMFVAALNGLTGVVAGAYGWHGLNEAPEIRDMFLMGVQYQMWHALALVAVAWLADRRAAAHGAKVIHLAGWAFTLGIVLFSGSLYVFAITGSLPFEGGAPAGGLLLMAGWIALMWCAATGR